MVQFSGVGNVVSATVGIVVGPPEVPPEVGSVVDPPVVGPIVISPEVGSVVDPPEVGGEEIGDADVGELVVAI